MINNYYTSEESPYKSAVTGFAGNTVSSEQTTDLTSVNSYNTTNGVKASTTGNITGVYDLNGGLWERASGYILNGNERLIRSGITGDAGSSGELMGTTNIANSNGYQTLSTRNYTVYPYNSSSDNDINNYNIYKSLLSGTYGYGDAILEISNSGSNLTSWNFDSSYFIYTTTPFFTHGGDYINSSNAGLFAFTQTYGSAINSHGFRVVLAAE